MNGTLATLLPLLSLLLGAGGLAAYIKARADARATDAGAVARVHEAAAEASARAIQVVEQAAQASIAHNRAVAEDAAARLAAASEESHRLQTDVLVLRGEVITLREQVALERIASQRQIADLALERAQEVAALRATLVARETELAALLLQVRHPQLTEREVPHDPN